MVLHDESKKKKKILSYIFNAKVKDCDSTHKQYIINASLTH